MEVIEIEEEGMSLEEEERIIRQQERETVRLCCRCGDVEMLMMIHRMFPSMLEGHLESDLAIAARNGHVAVVQFFLLIGAKPLIDESWPPEILAFLNK